MLEKIKINPYWAGKIRGSKDSGEEAPYSRPAIEQLCKAYCEAVPLLEFTQSTQLMELALFLSDLFFTKITLLKGSAIAFPHLSSTYTCND